MIAFVTDSYKFKQRWVPHFTPNVARNLIKLGDSYGSVSKAPP